MISRLHRIWLLIALISSACAEKPPEISYDEPKPAVLEPEPPKPVQVVQIPEPLPLPGQLKPLPKTSAVAQSEAKEPLRRVQLANAAAKHDPRRDGYINAIHVSPDSAGA